MSDRKVILKMVMSLDGFVTSPDGTHEWMFEWFGDDSGEWNRRALEAAGVHAMGGRKHGDRDAEGSERRRNHPGPRRSQLRQVADQLGTRRRIPAHHCPDCYRCRPEPIRRAARA